MRLNTPRIAAITLILPALSLLAAGCEYDGTPGYYETQNSPQTDTVAAQIERGGMIYGQSCAGCHGDAGQGTSKAPALVGAGALPLHADADAARQGEFRTALDIAVFATQSMPPKESARKKMKEADYWAVLAFALSANGVELSEPVGPGNAGSIVLHP